MQATSVWKKRLLMETGKALSPAVLETLSNRETFYSMLSMFYANTLTQEQIDSLAQIDYAALMTGHELLDEGFDDIRRYLRKRNTGTRQALATDYTGSFAGVKTYEERTAVPCGSLFLDPEGHYYTHQRGVVYGIYKQELFRLNSGVYLPEDHLSFELEFLGLMSKDCRQALEDGDLDLALHKLQVSRDFIEQNILSWFDDFQEIASKLIETRFYRGVMRVTKGWLQLDLQTCADLAEEIRTAMGPGAA